MIQIRTASRRKKLAQYTCGATTFELSHIILNLPSASLFLAPFTEL
jgi:hypothetical protein